MEETKAKTKVKDARSGNKPGTVELIQSYLMIAYKVIGITIFVTIPLLWVFRYAFYKATGYGDQTFTGLANLKRVFDFTDSSSLAFWKSVKNTFVFAISKLAVEIPLALVMAFLLSCKIKGRTFFRALYFMPSMLSMSVMGVIFTYLFAHQSGVINNLLRAVGLKPVQWFSSGATAMFMICAVSVWHNFGVNMLYFMTGLANIDPTLYEAATVDGASVKKQFFKITIPLLAPVAQMVFMNAFLGSLKITDLVLTFTDGRPNKETEVMMTNIYKSFFQTAVGRKNYGYASAKCLVVAAILGILTVIYLKLTNKSSNLD